MLVNMGEEWIKGFIQLRRERDKEREGDAVGGTSS